MSRAMRIGAVLLVGTCLVLALVAAGPHELLHDHGDAEPGCQLCGCVAFEVPEAPRVEGPQRAGAPPTAPAGPPELAPRRGSCAPRAPPIQV